MSLPMVLALTRKNTHTVNVLKFNSSVHEYLQTAIIYLRNKYFGCIFVCASLRERKRERERGNVCYLYLFVRVCLVFCMFVCVCVCVCVCVWVCVCFKRKVEPQRCFFA